MSKTESTNPETEEKTVTEQLQPLNFNWIEEAYTDRWAKGKPGKSLINPHEYIPGKYFVRRQGGEPHRAVLVKSQENLYGNCDCDGWKHHEGPCSHLIAIYRLRTLEGADDWGSVFDRIPPESITVELTAKSQKKAERDSEPEENERIAP
jgi:hypothetical protein